MPKICPHTGEIGYCWEDGLFLTIYCVCGIKITVTQDYVLLNRAGISFKHVYIPKHYIKDFKMKKK